MRCSSAPVRVEIAYEPLTAAGYVAWLRSLGVRCVALTDAAADYSALGEVALLCGGGSGLRPVFRSRGLEILRVPSPRPIVTGAAGARIRRDRSQALRLRLTPPMLAGLTPMVSA
jgi:hypothetical protein